MKLKCMVGHPKQAFVPLPGSAFDFLVVLHLPAELELRRAGSAWIGSGGLQPFFCFFFDP